MASAQYGQSNAQKSISTTLPRSCSSFSGAVLIQVSELLSSGAFCPTKTSSACCAHATLLVSKNASISLANIYRSPRCRLVQILSQLSVLVEPLLNVSSTVAAVYDRRKTGAHRAPLQPNARFNGFATPSEGEGL